ncbi:MAG: hypothetical protein Kow0081_2980 [Candidatus Dojkabacteria bacterium]
MFELLLFLCILPIVAIVLLGIIVYYNLKRKFGGLPFLRGPEALEEFFREIDQNKKSALQKKKASEKQNKTGSDNEKFEYEDADFKELSS